MKYEEKLAQIRSLIIKNKLREAFSLGVHLTDDGDKLDELRLFESRLEGLEKMSLKKEETEELIIEKNLVTDAFLNWVSDLESAQKYSIDQKKADEYYKLASELIKNEQYEGAITYFTKALEANPEHSAAYLERGTALTAIQKWQEAITDFTKAIELESDQPHGYYNRGMAYYFLGEKRKALDDWLQIKILGHNLADKEIEILKNELK